MSALSCTWICDRCGSRSTLGSAGGDAPSGWQRLRTFRRPSGVPQEFYLLCADCVAWFQESLTGAAHHYNSRLAPDFHYREAERLINVARADGDRYIEKSEGWAALILAEAHVHATLALHEKPSSTFNIRGT